MTDQPKVFISYRRDEPGNYAGHIYRALRDYFGPDSVFIDVVTLDPGTNWVDEIRTAVGDSRALVLVIGPQWAVGLGKADPGDQDFVELEVQIALERPGIAVIPVLVDGAKMPAASELPDSLQGLAGRQALELHDDPQRWDHGINVLRQSLEKRGFGRRQLDSERDRSQANRSAVDRPEDRDSLPLGTLVLLGVLVAFTAGLLAHWLVTALIPSPLDQTTMEAGVALSVARRAATWALVGGALAIWLTLTHAGARSAPTRAVVGLLLGGLAGAIGGTIDALPDITEQELGSWVDPAALGATGALFGALLGGSWKPPRVLGGLVAGGAAGVFVQLVFNSPPNTGGAALRYALIAGVVLAALAALNAAGDTEAQSNPARAKLPPAHPH